MNPYESPETEEHDIDLGVYAFALLAIVFLLLIPATAVAAWIGYEPERLAGYCVAVPFAYLLIVGGIACCLIGMKAGKKC